MFAGKEFDRLKAYTLFRKYRSLLFLLILTFLFHVLKINLNEEGVLEESYRVFAVDLCRNFFIICLFLLINRLLKSITFIRVGFGILTSIVVIIILVDTFFMFSHYSFLWNNNEVENTQSFAPSTPSFSSTNTPENIVIPHESYGFYNRLEDTVVSIITVNGETLDEVYYVTDKYGRRINRKDTNSTANKYAIFIGCSMTFGQHVQEDQTLPAWFSRLNRDFRSYNYGINGSGSNHYLAMLQDLNIRSQVKEKEGILVYSYFDGHIGRSIGDYYHFNWNGLTPYFFLKNDELIRKGNFISDRYFTSLIFGLLQKSYFIKSIGFNYPSEWRAKDLWLTVSIIEEMRNEYTKQFGNDNFFVLLLPGFEIQIVPWLEKKEINYIDCRNVIDNLWDGKYNFPLDAHPTGLAYRVWADTLTKRLIKHRIIER